MIDWMDTTRKDRLAFELIDPNDLESSRGWLDGVIRDGSSIEHGYYTDTRTGGKLKVADANYIDGSLVRIHHFVDAWDYHAELGTFYVVGMSMSEHYGMLSGDMELKSRLSAMDDDKWVRHYSISEGRYAKEVLASIFSEMGLAYSISPSVRDYRYSAANVYDYGERVLTTAFEVCDKANARLSVDGHGGVTAEPYVVPSECTPVWTYGANNIVDAVSISTSALSMPSRIGVIHKTKDDQEITAYADVAASSPASRSRRGRRITEIVDVSDMSPETYQRAVQIAQERLASATTDDAEYEFDALYWPGREGDAVVLEMGGKRISCMIKNMTISLSAGLITHVTLKGV